MQLDDYSRRGALQRWMLIDGQPRCPYDAIDAYRLSPAEAASVLAGNAAVRDALVAAEALEGAYRLRAGAEPPQTVMGLDEAGESAELPNPAHAEWVAAAATIAGASVETRALFLMRHGGGPQPPEIAPPDPYEDRYPTGPVPEVISDRQFVEALKAIGLVNHAEALAFVRTGEIPALMMDAIADLPDEDERETAERLISGATEFRRSSPLTAVLAASRDWHPRQVDDLWRSGSAL